MKEDENKINNSYHEKVERADRVSRRVITVGGYGIIISIALILLFLVFQSLPLAQGASVEELLSIPGTGKSDISLLTGVDPLLEVFFEVTQNGRVNFYNIKQQKIIQRDSIYLSENEKILTAARGAANKEIFALGTNKGRVITAELEMDPVYKDQGRTVEPSFKEKEEWTAEIENDTIPNHIEKIAFSENEDGSWVWCWVDHSGHLKCKIYDSDDDQDYIYDLSPNLQESEVTALAISNNAENMVVATDNNNIFWFDLSDFEDVVLKDRWNAEVPVNVLNYLLGDQAVVVGGLDGSVSVWLPVRTPANLFKYRKMHDFTYHDAAVNQIYVSPRNRNFLTVDGKGNAKLHYSTTGATQLEFKTADFPIAAGAFSPKSNAIFMVDTEKQFTLFALENPHPESATNALFGNVWYEGYPEPELVWQSTGGSDEFEPKLSLIPLIFGTLKGTIFAMLFSIPLAILAAIYVSQFAPVKIARTIKPTVEIMAALPSVVIGFLAGLYFSPFFEKYLVAIFLTCVLTPVLFFIGIVILQRLGDNITGKFPAGFEILFSIPVLILSLIIALTLDSSFEQLLFGGNFQQWIYSTMDITYETRNSLVVGFALGFAVIPIIFTVSEDALSNVPQSLTSASLALGASRWQTVQRVVFPAASGGIFAAIMLGLGRAVGETMIVLMATGNTPIIDMNPFNGFRAMSACIAVEMPEAPVGGTLYRVLFLTGLLLFIFTFVVNTASSLIGDRLRKKYARF